MIKALYSTLVEICDSKKALAIIGALIAWLALKFGWNVDQGTIDRLLAVVSAYVLGQGIADHGKEAAIVTAKAAANDNATPAAAPAKLAQAGFSSVGLLAALALMGTVATVSMMWACKGPTPVPVSDIIDCAKLETRNDWSSIEGKLKPDFDAHNWSQLVSDAEALGPSVGLDIASCVAVELVQQYLSTKQAGGDTWGAHDAIDKLRAKLSAPGKSVTFKTSAGSL